MKLSLNWLQRHVDHGLTPEDLAFRMTMAGLEVENVEEIRGDTVFEIEVTPNRPDCLSILGLAREVSAIVNKPMMLPGISEYEDGGEVDITIEDPEGCSRYIGTLIEDVEVKPLDQEMADLQAAIGVDPISNIVDITNFVLFEQGQPLHAFDYDKLEGGKIIVRRAKKGEKIVTLDNVERELEESILVIADAKKPVAIAGIMGGVDTAVTADTKRVLLEAASFDMGIVRRASRKLGLSSDSCYRFERGVAWIGVEDGSNRATDLIGDLAGGQAVARQDVIAKEPTAGRNEITVTVQDIQDLLGAPLDMTQCEKILKRLGCIVVPGQNALTVITPRRRNDLIIKEDIIEEVARITGYDNLPMSLPHVPSENIVVDHEKEKFFDRVVDLMVAQGLEQIVTYSLVGRVALEKAGFTGEAVGLQNPMSAEQELMRPTSVANILPVVAANLNRGQKDLKLFELGKNYSVSGERWTLSVVMTSLKKKEVGFFDIKGVVEEALERSRVKEVVFEAAQQVPYENGQCARVSIHGQPAGFIGQIKGDVLAAFEIKKQAVFFAEIDLEIARDGQVPLEKFAELNDLPSVVRDISLAVKDGSATFAQMQALCRENGGDILREIDLIEIYTGEKIDKGSKGYVLTLTYQADGRTLTDEEVNSLHEGIVQKLVDTFGAVRR